jgi:hypothetical protein
MAAHHPRIEATAKAPLSCCVYGNHGRVLLKALLHGGADVPELCVTIGKLFTLLGLAVAPQTVARSPKIWPTLTWLTGCLSLVRISAIVRVLFNVVIRQRFGIPPRFGVIHCQLQLRHHGLHLGQSFFRSSSTADHKVIDIMRYGSGFDAPFGGSGKPHVVGGQHC